MIRLEALSKAFGAEPAVDSLDLEVVKGDLCVLLGPSGCGKSTALRLVNRLLRPDSGRVLIDGRDAATIPETELRRGIGYVIQSIGLFPHMRVGENVATVPRLLGWDKARRRRRVEELLDLVGLPSSYAARFPRELSGGEAQRIGVARALAADPPILLMDEPFGALDPLTRQNLQAEFRVLQERLGTTVIFVTHDVGEALRLGKSMALMRAGRILKHGRPEDFAVDKGDPFIDEFLGHEFSLDLLSRVPARERMRSLTGTHLDGLPCLRAEASLREALAALAGAGRDRLVLVDGDGASVGELRLEDVLNRNGPDSLKRESKR